MPLRAVVFDFDGVIVNSEPLHFRALQDALDRRRAEAWTVPLRQVRRQLDHDRALRQGPQALDQAAEAPSLLQVSQSGRVRRRDIDDEEVAAVCKALYGSDVVFLGGLVQRCLVLADVDRQRDSGLFAALHHHRQSDRVVYRGEQADQGKEDSHLQRCGCGTGED